MVVLQRFQHKTPTSDEHVVHVLLWEGLLYRIDWMPKWALDNAEVQHMPTVNVTSATFRQLEHDYQPWPNELDPSMVSESDRVALLKIGTPAR